MKMFLRNLATLLMALVLALAVWVSAVTSADPDEVRSYPHPISLEVVGQDSRLVIVGSIPDTVNITMRAPKSTWDLLTASDTQIRAILDLSGLGAGTHNIRVQAQIKVGPVRVMSISPQVLELSLEQLETRSMPVELSLSGEPPIGYQTGKVAILPREAVISGPASRIERVARVVVDLNIAGQRQDVQSNLPLRVIDSKGQSIEGITVNPGGVQVSLPITQQGGYRDIAVKVGVRGQVAGGYRLTNITVFPPILTVFSETPSIVNDLPGFVETEPLNLNGESQNIDTRLTLMLPPGVQVIGDQTVRVQVGIAAIESSLSLGGIPIEVIGLSPGLEAHISPALVDVILTGPLPLLDKLGPGDVKFIVDLTGLGVGIHQATPQAQILVGEIRVQSLNPGTIEVTITSGSTPATTKTPAPTPTR